MIKAASARIVDRRVSFLCTDFQDFRAPDRFDAVVSGMAMHLVPDLSKVAEVAYANLRDGGRFIFTQRHPMRTVNPNGEGFVDGRSSWVVSDYFSEGSRHYEWLDTPVTCYHRTIDQIVSSCRQVGFFIEEVAEPQPQTDAVSVRIAENLSSPSVLLIHLRR
jgi:SAM-dependent methyltransferase